MTNPFTISTSFSSFPISPRESILSRDAVCTVVAGHAVHAGQTCKFSTVKAQSTKTVVGGVRAQQTHRVVPGVLQHTV